MSQLKIIWQDFGDISECVIIWDDLQPSGFGWGSSGSIWADVESSASIWDHMCPSRLTWDRLGSSWIIWDQKSTK